MDILWQLYKVYTCTLANLTRVEFFRPSTIDLHLPHDQFPARTSWSTWSKPNLLSIGRITSEKTKSEHNSYAPEHTYRTLIPASQTSVRSNPDPYRSCASDREDDSSAACTSLMWLWSRTFCTWERSKVVNLSVDIESENPIYHFHFHEHCPYLCPASLSMTPPPDMVQAKQMVIERVKGELNTQHSQDDIQKQDKTSHRRPGGDRQKTTHGTASQVQTSTNISRFLLIHPLTYPLTH